MFSGSTVVTSEEFSQETITTASFDRIQAKSATESELLTVYPE